jgi:hypothetical protein
MQGVAAAGEDVVTIGRGYAFKPWETGEFVELLEGLLLRNPWYVRIPQALVVSCFSFRFINLGFVLFTQARANFVTVCH